jgi:hypothetical protein
MVCVIVFKEYLGIYHVRQAYADFKFIVLQLAYFLPVVFQGSVL